MTEPLDQAALGVAELTYARLVPSLSNSKRVFLIVGPPVFVLLGAWCLSFAFTFDRCDRACISEGAGVAVIAASAFAGLLLVSVSMLDLRAWFARSQRVQMAQLSSRVAVPAMGMFLVWFVLMIWASTSVST